MIRITSDGVVKLCGLFYAVEVFPGLHGSSSYDYGDGKTAVVVDRMLARGIKPYRYLEEKKFVVFTDRYLLTHDRYDMHMEIRVLGGLLRHFLFHLHFLTRISTQHRINTLKIRAGRFESSDSIMRFKNLITNMNVDDTNGPTTRFQLTPELALKHIFFYGAKDIINFMRRLHSHPNELLENCLSEDKYRSWMLGDSVTSWTDFLSSRMQRFIREENTMYERKSNPASVSSCSHSELRATKYDGCRLFDLIRLFRHLNEHMKDIERRHKGVTAHIGSSEEDLVTYFSLNIPAMFSIFWVLGIRCGITCVNEGLDDIQFNDTYDEKFPEWTFAATS